MLSLHIKKRVRHHALFTLPHGTRLPAKHFSGLYLNTGWASPFHALQTSWVKLSDGEHARTHSSVRDTYSASSNALVFLSAALFLSCSLNRYPHLGNCIEGVATSHLHVVESFGNLAIDHSTLRGRVLV